MSTIISIFAISCSTTSKRDGLPQSRFAISKNFLVKEQLDVQQFMNGSIVSSPVTSPYSPTEAPTDYHVNRSLKNWQTNKIYNDLDDLIDDVKAWIASKDRLFFARGIDRLPSKWQSVIDVGGEYAPE